MRVVRFLLGEEGAAPTPRVRRLATPLVVALMLLGVLWVYAPCRGLGQQLVGIDYLTLHKHRIQYAQEALLGGDPHLPGWYTRELMGTPFWSNIQSFPFVPTRLVLLLFRSDVAYQVGIALAATLAALFTYLFCRSRDMSRLGAAAAGWTFACSGWFAARVMCGHLPLLEAYPALPLLLWLAETAIRREEEGRPCRLRLLALGLAALAAALCGHPQLPIYAIAVTACYILYRDFGRRAIRRVAVLVSGGAAAAFCLWPMALLARESTRFLDLDPPANDVVFPFARLEAFVLPWADGWPASVRRFPAEAFSGYPSRAWFWDTVCYSGVLPIVALVALVAVAALRRRRGQGSWQRPWPFFFFAAAVALVTALPPLQAILEQIPGTVLRSPARQVYVVVFALSLGFGALVSLLWRWRPAALRPRLLARALALACVCVQLVDLGAHDRVFVWYIAPDPHDEALLGKVRDLVGDQRVATDRGLVNAFGRGLDDVGFFDSAILGRPYRAVTSLSRAPAGRNTQIWDGWQMDARGLAYLGVKLVYTQGKHRGGRRHPLRAPLPVWEIPDPAPRAAFFPRAAARFVDGEAVHRALRDPKADVRGVLRLPPGAEPERWGRDPEDGRGVGPRGDVEYRRDGPDRIACAVRAGSEGYLRLLESWHEGWTARVDGEESPIILADDWAMAVHLPAGRHEVALEFATPGKRIGFAASLLSLALMIASILVLPRVLGARRG
jgi:hypothetical protein